MVLAQGGRTNFGPCFLFPAGADHPGVVGALFFCEIMTDLWCCGHALETQQPSTSKMQKEKEKKIKRIRFHLDFILHLTSISSFSPFLSISILHSCTWNHLLKHSVLATFQPSRSLPSPRSEALDLKHKSSLGNFLIEQKPGYMKPHGKTHPHSYA